MDASEFGRIGKRLMAEHLVGGNFGNMSVRIQDDGFVIKRTGAFLDEPGTPVFVPLMGPVPHNASSEYRVHREVYLRTSHMAIIHAHPPYAVAASFGRDAVIPVDSEGKMSCPNIPIVTGDPGTDDLAQNVAAGLAGAGVVIARGHGTFAGGKSLEEAFTLTSLAEHACRVIALSRLF